MRSASRPYVPFCTNLPFDLVGFYNVIPALLDRIVELAFDPRVASFFGVCLGLYILRDVVRICFRLMESFWRGLRKKGEE